MQICLVMANRTMAHYSDFVLIIRECKQSQTRNVKVMNNGRLEIYCNEFYMIVGLSLAAFVVDKFGD